MPARTRSEDGIASLAYVAGIHVFPLLNRKEDVDGRDFSAKTRFALSPGHDEKWNVVGKLWVPAFAGTSGERACLNR